MTSTRVVTDVGAADDRGVEDPREPVSLLLRDLRSSPSGISDREAARRLLAYGPNELSRRGSRRWPRELVVQFTHPLALLLAGAAVLSAVNGSLMLAAAILAVIVINAAFAFAQEIHAEHAVEALAAYLPQRAAVIRDGRHGVIDASELVPGDVLVIDEGDRISADARLLSGTVEIDLSTLTGESQPVTRSAETADVTVDLLRAPDMVFSGSACLGGQAQALVTATGMRTEIGRIAALSERVGRDTSPLEIQVRRVAKLIAVVAAVVAVAFLPLGLVAGLSVAAAISFAIGLLVANVPEGLLPTITLALAVGVQDLARRGAVVKRLSAVETLGSTTVICTDKTGTLTRNRMTVDCIWTAAGGTQPAGTIPAGTAGEAPTDLAVAVATAAARCCTAKLNGESSTGDPTEIALIELAAHLGAGLEACSDRDRRQLFRFNPSLRLMTTIDALPEGCSIHTKGAPEAVLPRSISIAIDRDSVRPLNDEDRQAVLDAVSGLGRRGLRVLAVGRRQLAPESLIPQDREQAEADLCLLGLIGLVDPPRPEVRGAIARAHAAGLRIHVVTGDNGDTAAEIARQVGIGTGSGGTSTVNGDELDGMSDADLDAVLMSGREIVFARSSPEAKLRIADALRATGQIVAMTGDGVNDAPALRTADIGVAMGLSGTEVARQAATMILTDDNFSTIVDAIEQGRRVYDNVRKFILYIFTHAVPEVAPFLLFALAGGAIPLPLTVMQILAIDLGTDTLPALALSREEAEPGVMERPPRPTTEPIIRRSLLVRSWGFLGLVSAVLVLGGYLITLHNGGWSPHSAVGVHTALHHVYQQATTVAWLGIVACQVGTAFAARTDRASLRAVGIFSNRLLLAAIGVALVFAAVLVYVPFMHAVFGTAALSPGQLATIMPFPVVIWGVDELRRWWIRRHGLVTASQNA